MKTLFLDFLHALWTDPAAARHWLSAAFFIIVGLMVLSAFLRWPVLKPFFHALWYDEAAARRWLFGLLGFLTTLATLVFADGVEVAFTWTTKQWAAKVLTATVALVFSMVNPAGKAKAAPEVVLK